MAPPVSSIQVATTTTTESSPNSATVVECNTSSSLTISKIKHEKRIDRAKIEKMSLRQHTPNTPIAFSISNILSNDFGNTKLHTNNNQINRNNNKVISDKKNSVLFRPYDDDCGENGQTSLDHRNQSDDEESNGE